MPASAVLLAVACSLVLALWIRGVSHAASVGAPRDRRRLTATAVAIAAGVVAIETLLATSGALARFDAKPPAFVPFMVGCVALAAAIAYGPLGRLLAAHTSLAALVGFQAVRVLAEAVIFAAVREGRAPVQMSFEGLQFDIVTGVTALPVALVLRRHPDARRPARAFTFMGLGFLVVIVVIASLSMPTPFRRFLNEPSNAWVTTFPYVFLPGILVVAAIAGHLITLRKLRAPVAGG
jgi:hypothetical protein